jgi:hypothetical protein
MLSPSLTRGTSDQAGKQECYYWPKKFSNDHKCIVKGVFLLELDEDVGSEAVAEELDISQHTLTGTDIGNTMQLQVRMVS